MSAFNARVIGYLLLPPMMWAGNAVVGRMLVGSMPPVAMNALRWCMVAVLLWPLVAKRGIKWSEVWLRWPYLFWIGALGVGTYNALQYLALRTSLPLNVTLIGSSIPVWMMLVGRIGFGQRLQIRQILGALISMAGVLLVMAKGDFDAFLKLKLVPGDLLMLLASLEWAIYSWLLAKPPAHMQAGQRPNWDWATFLWLQVIAGVAWAILSSGAEAIWMPQAGVPAWPHTVAAWAGLLFIAVGPSILAYRFWGLGVQAVGPTMAAFFINFTPVFAALWSTWLLGEHPRWYHPVALLLILSGIAVSSLQKRRRELPRLEPKGG